MFSAKSVLKRAVAVAGTLFLICLGKDGYCGIESLGKPFAVEHELSKGKLFSFDSLSTDKYLPLLSGYGSLLGYYFDLTDYGGSWTDGAKSAYVKGIYSVLSYNALSRKYGLLSNHFDPDYYETAVQKLDVYYSYANSLNEAMTLEYSYKAGMQALRLGVLEGVKGWNKGLEREADELKSEFFNLCLAKPIEPTGTVISYVTAKGVLAGTDYQRGTSGCGSIGGFFGGLTQVVSVLSQAESVLSGAGVLNSVSGIVNGKVSQLVSRLENLSPLELAKEIKDDVYSYVNQSLNELTASLYDGVLSAVSGINLGAFTQGGLVSVNELKNLTDEQLKQVYVAVSSFNSMLKSGALNGIKLSDFYVVRNGQVVVDVNKLTQVLSNYTSQVSDLKRQINAIASSLDRDSLIKAVISNYYELKKEVEENVNDVVNSVVDQVVQDKQNLVALLKNKIEKEVYQETVLNSLSLLKDFYDAVAEASPWELYDTVFSCSPAYDQWGNLLWYSHNRLNDLYCSVVDVFGKDVADKALASAEYLRSKMDRWNSSVRDWSNVAFSNDAINEIFKNYFKLKDYAEAGMLSGSFYDSGEYDEVKNATYGIISDRLKSYYGGYPVFYHDEVFRYEPITTRIAGTAYYLTLNLKRLESMRCLRVWNEIKNLDAVLNGNVRLIERLSYKYFREEQ